jgi:hypothetical protein
VRAETPDAILIHTDPLIGVQAGRRAEPRRAAEARAYHQAQFEALAMLAGRREPELGGAPGLVDVVGLNYYSDNQWIHGGRTIPPADALYKPLRSLLAEAYRWHGKPILLSETGAEGDARAAWLRYVAAELRAAAAAGVPLLGVCLYPVLHYPGWEDERHCECGLLGNAEGDSLRPVDAALAAELERQFPLRTNS